MASLGEILARHWPDDEWAIDGDDYSALVWYGPGPKPSEAAIRARTEEVNTEIVERDKESRHARKFVDRPDAVVRAIDVLVDGQVALKRKLDDLISKIQSSAIQGGRNSLENYDQDKINKLQALRKKINDIRSG